MNEKQAIEHWAQNRGQSAEVDAENWKAVEKAREDAQQAHSKKSKAQADL